MSFRSLGPWILLTFVGCGRAEKTEGPAKGPSSEGTPVADAKPAAKAPPTLYRVAELIKVVDLREIPHPAEAKFERPTFASVAATVPGKVPETAEFYRTKMQGLGWSLIPIPGAKATDEYETLRFGKDGHIAQVSFGKGFQRPNEGPQTSLNFLFHGNLDARTLPNREAGMIAISTPTTAVYRSKNPIADEGAWATKALQDAGWHEYTENMARGRKDDGKFILRTFRNRAYGLTLYVSQYGPGNETNVNYNVRVLPFEVPVPPGSIRVEMPDDRIGLRCESPLQMKDVGEFYQKEMPAAGYPALPSDEPHPAYWNLKFAGPGGDLLMVQLAAVKGEDKTRVVLLQIPAKVAEKLKQAK